MQWLKASCVLLSVLIVAAPAPATSAPAGEAKQDTTVAGLPRLVDLGAHKCIPCKKMAPILKDLRKEYEGTVEVVFLDVWKDPKSAGPYGIRLIPTQIFFDRKGREVFRHEGYFSREEILKVFRDKLGVATR